MEILKSITDVGLIRKHNEDCVLAINHPKNSKIKLLIVADGMGGKSDGEIASNFLVNEIEKIFKTKSPKTLNDTDKTIEILKECIKVINRKLIKKYGPNHLGTTLTLALVNVKKTIILNVGDSRSYTYKNKKLLQETSDNSDAWDYYKNGKVKKDDLRYFRNNSLINACIGLFEEFCDISVKVINNNYEMILLFSDGVTDLLTDKKLTKLIRRTPKEKLLEKIIYEAVNVDQKLKVPYHLKRKYLANYMIPKTGRDNTSGVIYIKNV